MSQESSGLSVGWFDRAQENDVLGLYRETFDVTPAEGYLSWKYLDHPHTFNAATVAYHSEELVGALGAVPKRIKIRDAVVYGTHELDMMVKKDYRDRGTFFELFRFRVSRAAELGIAMSIGMNDRLLRALAERFLGYRDVDMIPQFVRILDTTHYTRQRFGGRLAGLIAKIPIALYFGMLDLSSRFVSRLSCAGFEVRRIDRFSGEFDELWSRLSPSIDIAVVRDSEYLNWRYVDNPARDFEMLSARDRSGTLCGYIVYALLEGSENQGIILELMTAPGSASAARLLIDRALSDMKSRRMKMAVSWAFPEQRNVGALLSAGFVMREQNLFLQIRNLSNDIDQNFISDRRNWFISIGDNDAFYGCLI